MKFWFYMAVLFFILGYRSDDGGLYFFFAVQVLGLAAARWLYRLDRSAGVSKEQRAGKNTSS